MYVIIAVLLILCYPSVFIGGFFIGNLYADRKVRIREVSEEIGEEDKSVRKENEEKNKRLDEYFKNIMDFTGGEE